MLITGTDLKIKKNKINEEKFCTDYTIIFTEELLVVGAKQVKNTEENPFIHDEEIRVKIRLKLRYNNNTGNKI